MIEGSGRFEVLLEDIQRMVKVIAEGQVAIVARLDRIDTRLDRLEVRMDRLEQRFDVFEQRFNAHEARFEELAADTQLRLKRIEGHLQLNGPIRRATQHKPTKRAVRRTKKT